MNQNLEGWMKSENTHRKKLKLALLQMAGQEWALVTKLTKDSNKRRLIYFVWTWPCLAVYRGPTDTVAESVLSFPKGVKDLFLLLLQAWKTTSIHLGLVLNHATKTNLLYILLLLKTLLWRWNQAVSAITEVKSQVIDLQPAVPDICWAHRVSGCSAGRCWTEPGHGAGRSGRPQSRTGRLWTGRCLSRLPSHSLHSYSRYS